MVDRRKQLTAAALVLALCAASVAIGFVYGRSTAVDEPEAVPPWIAGRLDLTSNQVERITLILERSCDQMLTHLEATREQMQPILIELRDAILAELTDEQKPTYLAMVARFERRFANMLKKRRCPGMWPGGKRRPGPPFMSADGGNLFPGSGQFQSPLLRFFDQLDRDGDGCLGRDEIRRGRSELMKNRFPPMMPPPMAPMP
ncbi:MAG: EF-hand domain-containing protein [Proteobacteria bacterium]|nr:EF-hand domain-containing protein [Pseudomonadota bacterium]